MSRVTSNDAAAYLHLAVLFVGLDNISIGRVGDIFDRDVTTAVCSTSIAINGTEGEVNLCDGGGCTCTCNNVAVDEDAAAVCRRVVRDSTVAHRECAASNPDAAAVASRRVVRDSAVAHRERAPIVVDAAAAVSRRVA